MSGLPSVYTLLDITITFMKALIFGVNGQGGFYLSNLLSEKGIKVVGSSRSDGGGRWIVGDVANREQVEALMSNTSQITFSTSQPIRQRDMMRPSSIMRQLP